MKRMLHYLICGIFIHMFDGTRAAGMVGPVEFCEGESFRAMCSEGEVVVIEKAEYGRMKLGRCLRIDYGNIGCSVSVLPQLDAWCSGRRRCEVRVSSIVDVIRDTPQPCPRDLRSYLEASYKCVKVERGVDGRCPAVGPLVLTNHSGFISNLEAETTGVGSIECPWIIRALPGQRINFTLYDFAFSRRVESGRNRNLEICSHVFATIKETDILASKKLCGGIKRISSAYTSVTNSAEVRIFSEGRENDEEYLLLHYEVLGCGDPVPPPGGWFDRRGDVATLHCNTTATSRQYVCKGTKWTGDHSQCPRGTQFVAGPDSYSVRQDDPGVGQMLWRFISGTHELSVAIIVTVALIIAIAILAVGLMCLRRRRNIRRPVRPPPPPPPPAREPGIYYSGGRKEGGHRGRSESSTLPRPPIDQYLQNENDYYRTWQLQRHAHNNTAHGDHAPLGGGAQNAGYPQFDTPSDLDGTKYTFHPVEHIYESPKFERREVQYYEVEQGAAEGHPDTSRNTLPHGSRS